MAISILLCVYFGTTSEVVGLYREGEVKGKEREDLKGHQSRYGSTHTHTHTYRQTYTNTYETSR